MTSDLSGDGAPATERLRELQRLRDNGLVTAEEFDAHRSRILDEVVGRGAALGAAGSRGEWPAGDARPEPWSVAGTPAAIDALLGVIEGWRQGGLIDDASAARLREHYGRRRADLVGPAPAGASTTPPVAGERPAPATPPAARRPPAAAIGEWATRRQADVLLYVGAFLLVISALIFVSSQDEALFGGWRVVLLAAYTAGFLLAGWLLRRRARVREAGPVFLAIGALMTPLNFLLLHNELLSDQGVPGELVWFIASIYSTAFYGFLFARGLGRLYAVPAGVALLSAWGSLAVTVGLPLEWGGPWWMAFALAGAAAAAAARRRRVAAASAIAVIASLSLVFAHLIALLDDTSTERWHLPVTHALLLAIVSVLGASWRLPFALLPAAALVTTAACAALWAAEIGAQWYSFPPLLAGAVLVAGRRRWAAWTPGLVPASLLLAIAGGLAPVMLMPAHLGGDSALAAAAMLAAGVLFAASAWRHATHGLLTWDAARRGAGDRAWGVHPLERPALGWAAFGLSLIAVGFAQRGLGVAPPDTGWAFAAIGALVSASLVAAAGRAPALLWPMLPPLLLAIGVSVHPVDAFWGRHALLLALAAAHVLAAFALLRRWSLAAAAVALGMMALAALWESRAWEWWALAACYAAVSLPLFGLCTRLRRYEPPDAAETEAFTAAHALSWLPLAAAAVTAAAALNARVSATGVDVATTVEYRSLVLTVLVFAPLIAFEARRLRAWEPAVAAMAVVWGVVAALWPVLDWPGWTLALAYSAAGAAAFAALLRWRRLGTDSPSVAVHLLSWSGLVLGPLAALLALDVRLRTLDADAASLVEFRALALLMLPLAAAVAFDGRRLGVRWAVVPATALAMVAVEFAIATQQPGNVQAHTLPAALYLALVGLLTRSSDELGRNLGWHEVLQLSGAALLVLPQAEQGLGPGGARWGLVLLVEGLALLAVALALNARWLAVSAVVTLSGVALRFLWVTRESEAVPYWVMLAGAGFLLLAVGLTVLLQREWWDRTRARLQHRWREGAVDSHASGGVPAAALLAALAPVLALLAVTGAD